MVERIKVDHFGPISHLDIEIKRLTVFIGSQGSGKSTVSKLLTIFRNVLWRYAVVKGDDALRQFRDMNIDNYFYEDTEIEYTINNLLISYTKGKFSCVDTKDRTNQAALIYAFEQILAKAGQEVMNNLGYTDIEKLKDNDADMNLFLANAKTLLYIPAERIIASQLSDSLANVMASGIPLGGQLREYMSLFSKARKEFSEYQVPFLNTTYKFENGVESISIGEEEKNNLQLSSCSSGLQSVLPLLMIMDYCTRNKFFDSFVVEEPEQNLFPSNQRELMRFLLSKWNNEKQNMAMIITSHSPYLLSILNNYLYASELGSDEKISRDDVRSIIDEKYWVNVNDCAAYSLGEEMNGGEFCKSVISLDSHLVDFNYLDAVSIETSEEYNRLQKLYISSRRKIRN